MERHCSEMATSDHRLMIDQFGNSSEMVYIEKFYLDDVIASASHRPHPAFVVDGIELDGIYISKYQNVVINGLACSIAGVDPTTNINFDDAQKVCSLKGPGWHLMTALEWGAIALWCQKNNFFPYGNNDMGKDIREDDYIAKISYIDMKKNICRVATGSGPTSWSHNGCSDGIYDLNGNIWEWNNGIRLVFGELQMIPNSNELQCIPEFKSDAWRAIDGITGKLILPNGHGTTPNSIKLEFADNAWKFVTKEKIALVNRCQMCKFSDITAHNSICSYAIEWLYALGCLPISSDNHNLNVSFYANNGAKEKILFRGGRFGLGMDSGLYKSCFDDERSYFGPAVGFRSAYICKNE